MPVRNEDITKLLSQCSATIEELSQDLHECQVQGRPLSHYAGNPYRAKSAKLLLQRQGLIELGDRSVRLTPLGQQHAIGKHSRNPDTQHQTVLFTDNVLPFLELDGDGELITPVEPNKISTVPFCVRNPEGKVMVVENVRAFSDRFGLIKSKLYLLNSGAVASHKGFVKA